MWLLLTVTEQRRRWRGIEVAIRTTAVLCVVMNEMMPWMIMPWVGAAAIWVLVEEAESSGRDLRGCGGVVRAV